MIDMYQDKMKNEMPKYLYILLGHHLLVSQSCHTAIYTEKILQKYKLRAHVNPRVNFILKAKGITDHEVS
ncbi:hypothetical protein HI914_06424 [Erysiphe necator]|nr:hypothetical protein HI914_06424 [Erysiphe necator]